MKTLDMVSPADPIDTTSSATAADLVQVLDLPAALSRRLERAQVVDLVVHADKLLWLRVPVGLQEALEGGQGVGAARSPERARTRPLDGLEGRKA